MKIVLVYPPCNNRNCEPFPMPNIAIAALHGYLRAKGAGEVSQCDLDRPYFAWLRRRLGRAGEALLGDTAKITVYCRGRAGKALKAELDALADVFLAAGGIERPGLLGITFADLREDPLTLNCSALIARRARDLWGTRTAAGHSNVPEALFRSVMARYGVFDFCVFANWGEEPLLRIVEKLEGGKRGLINTLEARAGGIKTHREKFPQPRLPPSPFYPQEILGQYAVEDRTLAASYRAGGGEIAGLFGRGDRELVVPYSFISTCSGSCAFCANDASVPSNCKSVDQVLGELAALKAAGVTALYFINSNFNDNYSYAARLCDGMIKNRFGFLWSDCANLRRIDESLLRKMRLAGAIKLTFGMETGSDRMLKYIRKGITVEKIERYLRASHRLGIMNHIELIGGLPGETEEDILRTEAFIRCNRTYVDVYSLNPFYLYRSSPFARQASSFGLKVLPQAAGAAARAGAFSERFDEVGGLKWPEKDRQIAASARRLSEAISGVSSYGAIDYEHIHLRVFLYRKLGHRNKALIGKIVGLMTGSFRPYNLDTFISGAEYFKHKWSRTAG
jgi:hypothetical protein